MRPAPCHPDKPHYSKGLCSRCYESARRLAHPERQAYMRDYLKRYKDERPEKIAEAYARRRADPQKRSRDTETKRNVAYRKKYGLTAEAVEALWKAQASCCGLCARPITLAAARVDHCHRAGHVRGILCSACNTGLGQLGDNREGLLRALAYLERADLLARAGPAK